MRILIIKLSAIGDVVHALPVLSALRKRYPDARISWLVGEAASGLLASHSMLDEVIVYPRRRFGELAGNILTWPRLLKEGGGFLRRFRSNEYDIVLDLQGLLKSGILTGLSRGRRKIGFGGGREGSSVFLMEKLPPYDPDEHAVLRYLRLAAYVDAPVLEPEFPLSIGSRDMEKAKGLLREAGAEDRPVLGLNPGATWVTKRWLSGAFAEAADSCVDQWEMVPVFFGSAGDGVLVREIAKKMRGRAVDLTGRTDLRTLAALYRHTRVVVSTDTGPLHLAAAAGARVVALFGPTAPWRTGPFGKGHQVVRPGLPCSPCFRRECGDPRCMREITPREVVDAVRKAIGEPAHG